MPIYAATIFLSAFLLFLVQPIIAKLILPWFGGAAAVWATCMVFFQAALLAGYGYAHFLVRRQAKRSFVVVHLGLLLAGLLLLPIVPSMRWQPTGAESPSLQILLLLIPTIGLPYFLLATTTPLLQAWLAEHFPRQEPVSAVRTVEPGVARRAARLPVGDRALVDDNRAGARLVVRLCDLRRAGGLADRRFDAAGRTAARHCGDAAGVEPPRHLARATSCDGSRSLRSRASCCSR